MNHTISKRNIFINTNINTKNINNYETSNSALNTNIKPEGGFKPIFVNPNLTGPYSKPKGLYAEKKYNHIPGKKLFANNLNNLSNIQNEEKN